MLDEKDLQTIQEMISASEERTMARTQEMISASEERVMERTSQRAAVLMEQIFQPQFNALAENIQIIMEKLGVEPRITKLESDVSVLRTAVRMNREDIEQLKKAQ